MTATTEATTVFRQLLGDTPISAVSRGLLTCLRRVQRPAGRQWCLSRPSGAVALQPDDNGHQRGF